MNILLYGTYFKKKNLKHFFFELNVKFNSKKKPCYIKCIISYSLNLEKISTTPIFSIQIYNLCKKKTLSCAEPQSHPSFICFISLPSYNGEFVLHLFVNLLNQEHRWRRIFPMPSAVSLSPYSMDG